MCIYILCIYILYGEKQWARQYGYCINITILLFPREIWILDSLNTHQYTHSLNNG